MAASLPRNSGSRAAGKGQRNPHAPASNGAEAALFPPGYRALILHGARTFGIVRRRPSSAQRAMTPPSPPAAHWRAAAAPHQRAVARVARPHPERRSAGRADRPPAGAHRMGAPVRCGGASEGRRHILRVSGESQRRHAQTDHPCREFHGNHPFLLTCYREGTQSASAAVPPFVPTAHSPSIRPSHPAIPSSAPLRRALGLIRPTLRQNTCVHAFCSLTVRS